MINRPTERHSAAVAVRPLAEEVEEIVGRGCADAVIVTGTGTGKQTPTQDLKAAKAAAGNAPVLAGSGAAASNVVEVLTIADGLIVGTALKKGGTTTNPVDSARVRVFINAAAGVR